MTQLPSNIVKKRVFVQETIKVYEESKWTIYAWWLVQGTVAGAFGAITFSPQLDSPWWLLTAYLLTVFVIKRATMKLAQRLFAGDMWWQVTNIFLASFLLAAIAAAVSRLTSWIVVALPLVVVMSYAVGVFHTTLRVAHVREFITWVWRAAPLGTVAALTGWLFLYTETLKLSTASSAAAAGALVGFLYAFLTTALLALMWDVSGSQSKSGTAYVDKHNEFEEGLKLHAAAIAANPKDPGLYVERALVHIRRGDLDQAQADAEHALALDPRSREAQAVRAIIMSEQGDVDAAISEFHKLVDCKLGYQVGYLYRGRAYSRRGDYDCALYDYQHSLRLAEDAALTLVSRAETYYQMGQYDLAIADCDATLSAKTMICSVYTMALVVRGKCYAAKDEHELARSDFEAVFNDTTDAMLLKEAAAGLHALPPIEDADDAE
jgi:tetratricopeptide (TPR) repeat protein